MARKSLLKKRRAVLSVMVGVIRLEFLSSGFPTSLSFMK